MSENDNLQLWQAIDLVSEIGYRWTDAGWILPHSNKPDPNRNLTLINIGDRMCDHLRGTDLEPGSSASENEFLVEASKMISNNASRHLLNGGALTEHIRECPNHIVVKSSDA